MLVISYLYTMYLIKALKNQSADQSGLRLCFSDMLKFDSSLIVVMFERELPFLISLVLFKIENPF